MTNADMSTLGRPLTGGERAWNRILEILPRRLARPGLACERGVTIVTPTRLAYGAGVTVQRGSLLHCGGKSWCDYDGSIALGDHVVIGPGCILYGAGGIVVGPYTHLGPGAMIITQSGVVNDASRFTTAPERIHEPVEIGRGVWIGAGAIIVGGSRLGDGCTVSPNSVVSGDYAPGSTLVGNPARVARTHSIGG